MAEQPLDERYPYAVDELVPARVERPGSRDELCELLRDASATGLAVAPVGGGGALHLGNVPVRYDLAIDTRGLNGVLAYHPTDLVLSVEAGATLAEVNAVLAEHGQMLPIESPYPEGTTLGGLIATGLSGPRRYGAGSLRDVLIGISVAQSSGSVASAGGMVVKNVSGFDMMRLYHGSLGSLGVIVSANFKVLPRPRSESTLLVPFETAEEALEAAARLRAVAVRPVALVLLTEDDSTLLAARYEGRSTAVARQSEAARAELAGKGEIRRDEESAAWWQAYLDSLGRATPSAIEIRVGSPPSDVPTVLATIEEARIENGLAPDHLSVWPTLGAVILRAPVEAAEPARRLLDALRAQPGVTAVLFDAPLAWKRTVDVYGPIMDERTHGVMRALKDELDPTHTLNPGRLPGRL